MENLEQMVGELRRVMPFKTETVVGDLVLVAALVPRMLTYALVNDISRDSSRRDEWWHLSLQLLTIPPQQVTWTLRTAQFTGQELFTMGGEGRFIQAVQLEETPRTPPDIEAGKAERPPGLRLVKG